MPDTLLSNLDGCAEIERAAVPAPGAADVCHLPIISVGSYPGDTHSQIYLVNKCGSWQKMEINLVRLNAVTPSNRSQSATQPYYENRAGNVFHLLTGNITRRLRAGRPRNVLRLQVGEKDFALLRRVYICGWSRPVSYLVCTASD